MEIIRQIVYPVKVGLVSLLCTGLIDCGKGEQTDNQSQTSDNYKETQGIVLSKPKDTSPLFDV